MAAGDRRIGLNTVVRYTPSGGSEYTLSADQTAFDYNYQVDAVDVTAGNEPDRYEKPTIRSLDFTLRMYVSGQVFETEIEPGTEGTLWVALNGVGSGKEAFSFRALIKGFSKSSPFDGAQEIELTGSRQGSMILDFGSTQA